MYYLRIAGANFPVAPESIEEAMGNKNETVDLASEKQINILKKPGLTSYTMDIRLPREEWPWAYYEQPKDSDIKEGFNKPEEYVKLLRQKKTKREHFQLMIVETINGSEDTVENFTEEVTLEDATFRMDSAEGDDIVASCTFKKWVDYATAKKKGKVSTKTKVTKKPKKKTYTVKAGDTLKSISKKMYGTQKNAGKIYAWNKKAIEKAAKKHGKKSSKKGKYIYKGTKLKLKTVK